jgi:hypothetical protein
MKIIIIDYCGKALNTIFVVMPQEISLLDHQEQAADVF